VSLPDAEALYLALIGSPERLRNLRRLTYWCDRQDGRCLLLDAVAVDATVLLHQKRYKYSDAVNERRSSEAGRARNTFDGQTHWKPRTYWIGQSALAYPDDVGSQLSIQCDHVGVRPDGSEVTLTARDFRDDWLAGHAEVRIRADGTRFAIR
jgi:hypothetical protein